MVIQQFMLDYPYKVNAAFAGWYGNSKNLSNMQCLNFQHDVAKAILSDRHSHLTKELEKKAKAQHAIDMEEWNMILNSITLSNDPAQYVPLSLTLDINWHFTSSTRDTLFDAVYPLLQVIGSYADCYITLIAGNARRDNTKNGFFTVWVYILFLRATLLLTPWKRVHWWPGDCSSMKNWTQWDSDGFNSGVAGPFLKYAGEISASHCCEMHLGELTFLFHFQINYCQMQTKDNLPQLSQSHRFPYHLHFLSLGAEGVLPGG